MAPSSVRRSSRTARSPAAQAMAPKVPPPSGRAWSGIPLELAYMVLRRLPAHVDRIRFTAVCSHWRAAAGHGPLPPPAPLLALPDGTVYSLPLAEPFRFPRCAGYTDACANWLVFSGADGNVFLKDPFSSATLALPPPSRVRVGIRRVRRQDAKHLSIDKVMLCSPRLAAAIVGFEESTRIAVCRPGAHSWWSVSQPVDAYSYRTVQIVDIAFHGDKIYALDHSEGLLYAVDFHTDPNTGYPWICRVRRVIDQRVRTPVDGYFPLGSNIVMETMYLVESRGDLLMVLRGMFGVKISGEEPGEPDAVDVDGRNEFQVFRADFELSRWIKVQTIGDDRVLFLRRRCCRSVRLSPEQMPGDSIVFMENDDEIRDCYDEESKSSCSVYSMKYGSVSTLLPAIWKRGTVFATWLFPKN